MSLTDTAIRGVKPTDKAQKLFDGNGLFLFVAPSGTKSWRVKYRFQGREKLLTLGTYPQISLKEAREACADAKKQLSGGTDPSAEKRSEPEAHKPPLKLSRGNGTKTRSPSGRTATPGTFWNASTKMFSLLSERGPLAKSLRRSFWPCCGESKCAEPLTKRTGYGASAR
jgi:hypothetical protein